MNINLERNKERKQNILIALGIFILVTMIGGFTFAFFNYTRTGGSNTVRTGNISFNSNYENVTLNGIFPINKANVNSDSNNVMTVNVSIEGNTTYEYGLWYYVTMEDVHLTVNNKEIPISFEVSASDIPGIDTRSYSHGYIVEDGDYFATGFIPKNTDIDGTLTIKAYIDRNYVAISDTYDGNETGNMGTTNAWVNNRVVLTTNEWNNLSSQNNLSFKVKVVSEEAPTPTDALCFTTTTTGEEEGKIAITGYDVSCGGTDLVLPEKIDGKTVATIKQGGLYNKGLTSLVLNNGLEVIKDGGITGNNISSIYIPSTIKDLGSNGSTGLASNNIKNIYIANGVEKIGNIASNNIEKLYIPSSVELYKAGFGANDISKIYLSDGIRTIGDQFIFNYNQIFKVVIPSSVESMKCSVFDRQTDGNGNSITTQIIYENPNFTCTE